MIHIRHLESGLSDIQLLHPEGMDGADSQTSSAVRKIVTKVT